MEPPASIDVVGSYPLGTCIKPRVIVDLAVTIPAVSYKLQNNGAIYASIYTSIHLASI